MPTNKVIAGSIAGAIVTLGMFAMKSQWPEFVVPADVAAAATTVVSFLFAYFVPDRANVPTNASPMAGVAPAG